MPFIKFYSTGFVVFGQLNFFLLKWSIDFVECKFRLDFLVLKNLVLPNTLNLVAKY